MSIFSLGNCIYCGHPVTWLDWLRGKSDEPSPGKYAHNPCKVEPKAGA